MTGLVFATEEEAQPFLKRYARARFEGLLEGETSHDSHTLVTITGLGKIKATLRTERLLQHFELERLLHVGTCTALRDELAIGDLVAASHVLEGDRIELAAPTYPRMPLEVPFELAEGTLVTQDHLITGEEEQTYWQRIADLTDTTGYAIAYVAATRGIPCHITKVVAGRPLTEDKNLQQTLAEAYETLARFLIEKLDVLVDES